jgi:hypothetical protein
MKSYLFVAYIAEGARITKKILIVWDVEMKRNLLMTALLVHVVLAKVYFTVENVKIFHVVS